MAGIKISQLTPGGPIQVADEIPIARAGLETFKILASQIVTDGVNIGTGPGQLFADKIIPSSTALRFRTLSADQGLTITTSDTTINISTSGQNPIKTTFYGNASAISFPINGNFSRNTNNYRVDINGVLQEPLADYTVVGSNIIFTTPPPLNSKVVVVANNLVTVNETIPADNSVTTQKIALTAVTQDKIAPNAITTQKIALTAVTQDKIAPLTATNVLESSGVKIIGDWLRDLLLLNSTIIVIPNNGLTVTSNISAVGNLFLTNIPITSAGLSSGGVWRDVVTNNTLRIVP